MGYREAFFAKHIFLRILYSHVTDTEEITFKKKSLVNSPKMPSSFYDIKFMKLLHSCKSVHIQYNSALTLRSHMLRLMPYLRNMSKIKNNLC